MTMLTTTRKVSFLYLAGVLALSSLPACKRVTIPLGSSSNRAAPGEPRELSADEAEGTKLSAAIECLNRHSGRVFEVRDSYVAGVDPATGSSHGKKPPMRGLYGIDGCQRDVKQAGTVVPAVADLDKASANYAAVLGELIKSYEELSAYYEKGDYLEDEGKKSATLHPKVMAAFKSFSEANHELSSVVKTRNRQRRMTKLAAREKAEGRNLEVIIDSMMLEGETLVSLVSKPEVDLAELDRLLGAYGKLVDEVDAYAGAHPDEAKKRGSIINLRNYDKTFLSASRVVARKLKSKTPPAGDELDEVDKQYNRLVDNYNNH